MTYKGIYRLEGHHQVALEIRLFDDTPPEELSFRARRKGGASYVTQKFKLWKRLQLPAGPVVIVGACKDSAGVSPSL